MSKIIPVSFLLASHLVFSGDNRPNVDPIGYPWTTESVQAMVNYLEKEKLYPQIPAQSQNQIIGAIVPHDDYLYSAPTSFPVFQMIHASEVVVFGVTHSRPRKTLQDPQNKIILDTHPAWQGPFGPVHVSPLREHILKNMPAEEVLVSNEGHRQEHSIEAMIPFLQYVNRDVKITPIMVSTMDFPDMDRISNHLSALIAGYMKEHHLVEGRDIFFLISCDATHYGTDFKTTPYGSTQESHDHGVKEDKRLVSQYLIGELNPSKIRGFCQDPSPSREAWCGKYSVPFGLLTMQHTVHTNRAIPVTGQLIQYADSYSRGALPVTGVGMGITAPFNLNHWVGYFSSVYSIPK